MHILQNELNEFKFEGFALLSLKSSSKLGTNSSMENYCVIYFVAKFEIDTYYNTYSKVSENYAQISRCIVSYSRTSEAFYHQPRDPFGAFQGYAPTYEHQRRAPSSEHVSVERQPRP